MHMSQQKTKQKMETLEEQDTDNKISTLEMTNATKETENTFNIFTKRPCTF